MRQGWHARPGSCSDGREPAPGPNAGRDRHPSPTVSCGTTEVTQRENRSNPGDAERSSAVVARVAEACRKAPAASFWYTVKAQLKTVR